MLPADTTVFSDRPDLAQFEQSGWKCSLDATLLARTASIVGDRRNVFDQLDVQPGGLQRSDRTFTTRARTFDAYLDIPHAEFGSFLGCLLSGALPCKRCAFPTSLEATRPRTRPAQRVTFGIGDRHCSVVKSCMDVRDAVTYVSTNSFFLIGLCHCKVS